MSAQNDIAVRARASEMINRFAERAAEEASSQVNAKILTNDVDGALVMDQVRRAIIHATSVGAFEHSHPNEKGRRSQRNDDQALGRRRSAV